MSRLRFGNVSSPIVGRTKPEGHLSCCRRASSPPYFHTVLPSSIDFIR